MNKIKKLRYQLGMSQKELANAVGVTRQTINFIERGKLCYVTQATMDKLCEFFDTTPIGISDIDWIFKIKPTNKAEAQMVIDMLKEEFGC